MRGDGGWGVSWSFMHDWCGVQVKCSHTYFFVLARWWYVFTLDFEQNHKTALLQVVLCSLWVVMGPYGATNWPSGHHALY